MKERLIRPRNAGLLTFHGETVSDQWPPIVPLEDFRAVEQMLTAPERRRTSTVKHRYLLSGVLYCHCGRVMHGLRHSTRGTRYRCSVQFEHGTDRTGHTTRRMEPLDQHVRGAVATLLSDPASLKALIDAYLSLIHISEPTRPY